MEGMREIKSFKFPEIIIDRKGRGKRVVDALIAGEKHLKELYEASKGNKDEEWFEHRFIFFQTFFNQGCVFKIKGQEKPINDSICDLLGIDVNNMIEHPGNPQETQAVKTSRVVVNSFLKGEDALEKVYKRVKAIELPELSNRKDSEVWMKHYFGVIEMMFEGGIIIFAPTKDDRQFSKKASENITDIIEGNQPTCDQLQKIKLSLLKESGSDSINTDEIYNQYEKENNITIFQEQRDKFDDECF